ncbi:PRC-barrel domain containing protein [Bradyrhizobium sp. CB2312]|uniref:PRC-barrel domain containing protein n=1 Tax=Bradyrhizobium sp. CB2312 TaxID=3039155 RepID=UPI0024B212BC|nr:PRC-barrel domain containing protein [Bradyrhizobium sp. CB2312]WFU73219.1 PRC-barrel domain containing protein [Bradyrhizobium sp. CB2312]
MTMSDDWTKRATSILRELHAAEAELIGRGIILTDGKAGTVDHVFLDEVHGLRISIGGHDGKWPISTVKLLDSGSTG